MWNRGKSNVLVPVEQLCEPDPEWGARKRDPNHVKVSNCLLK